MGFLKREIKKFDYKPRYYEGEENPYKFNHQFDKFRSTVGKNKSLKAKLIEAVDDLKEIRKNGVNKTILVIIIALIFLFLLFIDFDLSIFLPKN